MFRTLNLDSSSGTRYLKSHIITHKLHLASKALSKMAATSLLHRIENILFEVKVAVFTTVCSGSLSSVL
jgi:hypothetical protein